jgi:hypothetical protein
MEKNKKCPNPIIISSNMGIGNLARETLPTIGHLTNYGQNSYFWTFWTFSYGGKSKNDTKPVSAGRRESKNRFKLKNIKTL